MDVHTCFQVFVVDDNLDVKPFAVFEFMICFTNRFEKVHKPNNLILAFSTYNYQQIFNNIFHIVKLYIYIHIKNYLFDVRPKKCCLRARYEWFLVCFEMFDIGYLHKLV